MSDDQDNPDGTDRLGWLCASQRVSVAVEHLLQSTADLNELRAPAGSVGHGGDKSLLLDVLIEAIVIDEFTTLANSSGKLLRMLTEERGWVNIGSPDLVEVDNDVVLLIDPLDGSVNARRGLPTSAVSIAVVSSLPPLTVKFGYIYEIATRTAWWTGSPATPISGEGARLLGIENAEPAAVARVLLRVGEQFDRIRCVGSIAVALAYVADGRLDAFATATPCRPLDAAAGIGLVRSAGGTVLTDQDESSWDLERKLHVIASRNKNTAIQLLRMFDP